MKKGRYEKILIDPEIHKNLKILSAQTGRSMKDLANEALIEYLKKRGVKI